jgi:tetratricopeptide (TPR) repeat protein
MEGALSALERAAEADPASAEVRAELAAFHLRRNDRDEAEAAGREALVLDADNAEAHRVLGLLTAAYADAASGTDASRARAFAEEAIDHLERAVATPAGATDIGLQYTLGRLYLRVDRANDAVDTLGAVVEENPGSVQARLTLAQAYASAGRLDDAIASLEAVVGQAPRVAATLGEYQEQAGRYLDAAESYTNALEQAPDNRELKFRRVAVLFNAGRYDDVATMAAVAAREHPGDSRFARMEVRGLFEGGSREAAYARMRALVAETPGDGSLRLGLADLYHDGDRTGDAGRVFCFRNPVILMRGGYDASVRRTTNLGAAPGVPGCSRADRPSLLLNVSQVPNTDLPVPSSRQQTLVVRRERNAHNAKIVFSQLRDDSTGFGIPKQHRLIKTRRGDKFAVGRIGDVIRLVAVFRYLRHLFAVHDAMNRKPYFQRRCNVLFVRRKHSRTASIHEMRVIHGL